jgi:hypothetical protein
MSPRAKDDEIEAVESLQNELMAAEYDIATGMGLAPQDVPHVREVLLRLVISAWRKAQGKEEDRPTLPTGVRGGYPFDDEPTPVIGPLGHGKTHKR